MANSFMGMVYAVLKDNNIDTSDMTPDECIKKFNELSSKENLKKEEQRKNKNKTTKKTLSSDVDKVLNGTYKDSHVTLLDDTPKILQQIGFPNKPILMTSKHVYLAINNSGKYKDNNDHYHNLGKKLFLDIPKLLQSPILVFKNHNKNDEIILVVNAVDKNNNPIILPIKLSGSGRQNFIQVGANIVKSAYGKNNFQNYIDKNVKEEDILLIENKKIRNLNS